MEARKAKAASFQRGKVLYVTKTVPAVAKERQREKEIRERSHGSTCLSALAATTQRFFIVLLCICCFLGRCLPGLRLPGLQEDKNRVVITVLSSLFQRILRVPRCFSSLRGPSLALRRCARLSLVLWLVLSCFLASSPCCPLSTRLLVSSSKGEKSTNKNRPW